MTKKEYILLTKAKLFCLRTELRDLKKLLTRTYNFIENCNVKKRKGIRLDSETFWNYGHNRKAIKQWESKARKLDKEIKEMNRLYTFLTT